MTTSPPDLACRHLASLWPAPARFAALTSAGAYAGGDAGLAERAGDLLATMPAGVTVVRVDGLVVLRERGGGPALAAEVPGAALPGLLEADLLRLTSAAA